MGLFSHKSHTDQSGEQGNHAASSDYQKVRSDIILNSIEDGVLTIDAEKVIRVFNPGAEKITGWDGKEAVGLDYHSVMKLVDDKDQAYDDSKDPFARVFKDQKGERDDKITLITRSNKRISLSLTVSPLFNDDKEVAGAVGVFRDVSQERQEEAQRAEFISTASHEMRTPVAAIEGYLSLALNDKVATIDSRARGYLDKAHSSTQHLGKLFQDLLTSAKADDGRLSSHPVVIEMSKFLEDIANDLRFTAQKKGLSMNFTIASSNVIDATNTKVVAPLYYIYADPDRLREVIVNLFDNATKYTDQGGITLGLTGDTNVVQFYIKDTGVGIPPEDIPHLFQKFYRVDNSATRTIGGTGLGLFICRKIVELYQGQIWVESEFGKGSTFFVNIPRLSTQDAESRMARPETSVSPISA